MLIVYSTLTCHGASRYVNFSEILWDSSENTIKLIAVCIADLRIMEFCNFDGLLAEGWNLLALR